MGKFVGPIRKSDRNPPTVGARRIVVFDQDVPHRKWRFGKLSLREFRKTVKSGARKVLVIAAGESLTEIRPPLARARGELSFFDQDATHRERLFGKLVSENPRKAVKLEKRKSLVIVAGGIWQKSAHRWRARRIVVLGQDATHRKRRFGKIVSKKVP